VLVALLVFPFKPPFYGKHKKELGLGMENIKQMAGIMQQAPSLEEGAFF
jgi:hypothetical protein